MDQAQFAIGSQPNIHAHDGQVKARTATDAG